MKWRGRRESENVEDRRGEGGGFGFPGGGGRIRFPMPRSRAGQGGGIGIMGLLIILGLMFLFGVDPGVILQGGPQGGIPDLRMPRPSAGQPGRPMPRQGMPESKPQQRADDDGRKFVSVVLADTEDVWSDLFAKKYGRPYQPPTLVLFSGMTRSLCGVGAAQMGPFYCPRDGKLYIDLSFYQELKHRFGAPGDFAQAYVIAHEVGHHVQTMLGIADQVQRTKMQGGERRANALQVRMELQADCLAGVWAKRADASKDILDPGDIEEALNAASAIGDDKMQRRSQGYVVPDAFTHGSSAQRVRWFKRGFDSGTPDSCDTFAAQSL